MRDEALHEQLDSLLSDRDTRAAVIAALAALSALSAPAALPIEFPDRPVRHRAGVSDSLRGTNTA